jgi:hypothetical protein
MPHHLLMLTFYYCAFGKGVKGVTQFIFHALALGKISNHNVKMCVLNFLINIKH